MNGIKVKLQTKLGNVALGNQNELRHVTTGKKSLKNVHMLNNR